MIQREVRDGGGGKKKKMQKQCFGKKWLKRGKRKQREMNIEIKDMDERKGTREGTNTKVH